DNWRAGLKAIQESNVGVIVACAAGEIADTKVLSEITPNVLRLNSADEKSISDFFKWVSSSVQVSSTKIESSGNESNDLGDLPPPPQGIDLIKH
ncbi:MAG: tellurium resistance protein TerY, partial [Bacteroidales bacterium]|nr:tellurium resistance protein TerY [Bacteroidales bacterium]